MNTEDQKSDYPVDTFIKNAQETSHPARVILMCIPVIIILLILVAAEVIYAVNTWN